MTDFEYMFGEQYEWTGYSFQPYANGGHPRVKEFARNQTFAIKNGNGNFFELANEFVKIVTKEIMCSKNSVIMPVPNSGHGKPPNPPVHVERPLHWMCNELVKSGFVTQMIDGLERMPTEKKPIRDWQIHESTIKYTGPKLAADVVVLLDDVITTGSTFAGAARVLAASGYKGTIVGLFYAHTALAETEPESRLELEIVATEDLGASWKKITNW